MHSRNFSFYAATAAREKRHPSYCHPIGTQHLVPTARQSFVRSKLNYGSVVYGSARESYLRILDALPYNHTITDW